VVLNGSVVGPLHWPEIAVYLLIAPANLKCIIVSFNLSDTPPGIFLISYLHAAHFRAARIAKRRAALFLEGPSAGRP
jgi:hypothetical protein